MGLVKEMIKLDSRQKRVEYLNEIITPYKSYPTIVTAERKFSNRTVTTVDFGCDFLYRHIKLFCEVQDPHSLYKLLPSAIFYYIVNDQAVFNEVTKLCHSSSNIGILPNFFQLTGDHFRLGKHLYIKYETKYTAISGFCPMGGVIVDDKWLFNDCLIRLKSRFSSVSEAGRVGLLHII